MDESQPNSPRRRLQVLLAIPERQRTDAEWDEINELEITLASQKPEKIAQQGMRRDTAPPAGHRKPGGRPQGKKPGKKFHRKPPRGNVP